MPYRRRARLCGLLLGLYLGACSIVSYGAGLSVQSPQTRTNLLELYTSEGCNTCPPADRWVSGLQDNPGLWRDFIPVAFHVDYWDYIGWPDRFASPAFSARQYTYASQQSMHTVYTPGFFLNGNEWRWRSQRLDQAAGHDAAGVLSLDVEGGTARIGFKLNGKPRDFLVNVALLGFGIKTEVLAGENNGRTLTHDFVVLSMAQKLLTRNEIRYSGVLPVPASDVDAERYALVAWVNQAGNQDPLQAVGGYLARE